MATYSNSLSKPGAKYPKVETPENFLDALRSLGRGAVSDVKTQVKQAITSDLPQSLGFSPSGTLSPNEQVSMDSLRQAENRGYSKAERGFDQKLSQMRQQEYQRLIQQEQANKQQIQTILAEIKNLAKSVGDFAQEVQVAAAQAPINPGLYHKNFYAHLRSVIATLRQRVESSKNWLQASNNRAKKQGHYWSSVKSSGTKFMLSSERYMVTSTG